MAPEEDDWNLIRFAISDGGGVDSKNAVRDDLAEMPFWFVGKVFRTYDFYAVAATPDNGTVDDLIQSIRGLESVSSVEYSIEAERIVDVNKYFPE